MDRKNINLPSFEFIQRAENGGHPMDNDTASELGMGHGTPGIMLPKRLFVALLHRAREAATSTTPDADFASELEDLIREHDGFLLKVDPSEIYGNLGQSEC